MWKKIKKIICSEAFMYLFIGGCTTLVNLVVFSVLTYGTSLGSSDLGITISNVVSIVLSILFAFLLKRENTKKGYGLELPNIQK